MKKWMVLTKMNLVLMKNKGITMYRTMYNQTLVNDSLCECNDIYIMCAVWATFQSSKWIIVQFRI